MTDPNPNTVWANAFVDELAASVDAVCLTPGSRSTPLTLSMANHSGIETFSHLDERSSAFFALGRARQTGKPVPIVCTSGTAAANFHPAVLEASESRVPLVVLTADRPPELQDSGANQTTDQTRLYGDAVRWYRTMPEPEVEDRKLRSLRVTAARAVAKATGPPAGPVHLNFPFRKPLEPTGDGEAGVDGSETAGGKPSLEAGAPAVQTHQGRAYLEPDDLADLAEAIEVASRGLIVCGPADDPTPGEESLLALARASGFPVLADPLSGHRFGTHLEDASPAVVAGGYDSYLDGCEWPEPKVVIRFGASPTSKVLRTYLEGTDARQLIVDPAGEWREATFTSTDLLVADPTNVANALVDRIDGSPDKSYRQRFAEAEQEYWDLVEAESGENFFEGNILRTVAKRSPDPSTLFVSNSMPVRDLDRFGRPRTSDIEVFGNRGVSGVDGITSTALGAGSASEGPLVLVTGDLAYYHDMNGLLALDRCDVDATIVLINNDGGGIFHKLPIESLDPPFTELFKTPHGLDFEPTAELYDLDFQHLSDLESFAEAFEESVASGGTDVLCVETDAEASHRFREQLHETVIERVQ